ncbi:MAG: radical SAM protein [Thermoplasmata archaeon]
MDVRLVEVKRAISPSHLPGLDWAINPYRGCGHACSYCYAQDVTRFELSRPWGEVVEVRVNIVSRLKKELERGVKGVFGIGTVTDPYQPLEQKYRLTRGCLVHLRAVGASVSILTKSDLVVRDLDLLTGWRGAEVGVSVGCTDESLVSVIEPGAPSPVLRFRTLSELTQAGVDTYLMAAPIISPLCDSEDALKRLVGNADAAGVKRVIWDRFNPKPCATDRLRRALASKGLGLTPNDSDRGSSRTRAILRRECARLGIELLDAF